MSSPVLLGSVLRSQQKGAVEEAPNDGWAYARYWNGTDYEWTKAPDFETFEVRPATGAPIAYYYHASATPTGSGDVIALRSPNDVSNTWRGGLWYDWGADVGEFYIGTSGISINGPEHVDADDLTLYANGLNLLHYDASLSQTTYDGGNHVWGVDGGPANQMKLTAGLLDINGSGTQKILLHNTDITHDLEIAAEATQASILYGAALPLRVGTTNGSGYLVFSTGADSERMRIDSAGDVAIGTSSPEAKLHVYAITGDGIKLSRLNNSAYMTVEWDDATTPINTVRIGHFAGGAPFIYTQGGNFTWNNYDGNMKFNNVNADIMQWLTNNTERLRLDQFGKFGIGTTAPKTLFHVENTSAPTVADTASSKTAFISNSTSVTTGNPSTMLGFSANGSETYATAAIANVKQSGNWFQTDLAFYTHPDSTSGNNLSERMRIKYDGKVGVGTSNPSTDFDVIAAAASVSQRLQSDTSGAYLYINAGGSSSNAATLMLTQGSGTEWSNNFELNQAYNNGYITSRHSTGNIILSTNSTEVMRLTPGGGCMLKEIAAADTDVAGRGQIWVKNTTPNTPWFTRDDGTEGQIAMNYEEGTFTPHLVDGSYNTSEGQTYGTNRSGRYMRVGRMCHVIIDLEISSLGSLTTTQQASIMGLPFTAASGLYRPLYYGFGSSLALGTDEMPGGLVVAGATHVGMWILNNATTGSGSMTVGKWSAGGRVVLSGWYEVA